MSRRAELEKAYRLYEDFREDRPRRARAVRITLPKAAMLMGTVTAIEYDTSHGGKMVPYRHVFAIGSRPFLAAGTTGKNRLLLYGGRYHVTERGIVDLDGAGHEIEHTRRKRTRI
jgi:hypothetical protein